MRNYSPYTKPSGLPNRAIPDSPDQKVLSREKAIAVPKRFKQAFDWIAQAWQVPVRATSYVRNSPGHSKGYALDVAPGLPGDFAYAPRFKRDPLLTNRPDVLSALTAALPHSPRGFLYFVETDHIHVVLAPKSVFKKYGIDRAAVFRWAYMKETVYPGADSDWANGRAGAPIVPEAKMAVEWPNRGGVTVNKDTFINGNALVGDLLKVHGSPFTKRLA